MPYDHHRSYHTIIYSRVGVDLVNLEQITKHRPAKLGPSAIGILALLYALGGYGKLAF